MNLSKAQPSTAVFCPQCGAASVDRNLVASTGKCRACGWAGSDCELVAVPFQHELGLTDEAIFHNFFIDVRDVLGKSFAVEIGRLLLQWGFLAALDPKLLARYLAAAARAMVHAILEERSAIEREQHGSEAAG